MTYLILRPTRYLHPRPVGLTLVTPAKERGTMNTTTAPRFEVYFGLTRNHKARTAKARIIGAAGWVPISVKSADAMLKNGRAVLRGYEA